MHHETIEELCSCIYYTDCSGLKCIILLYIILTVPV